MTYRTHSGEEISIRLNRANPNHHLWDNHGTWYIHYTLYPDNYRAERVRKSLRTRDVRVARERRDAVLNPQYVI